MGLAAAHAEPVLSCARDGGDDPGGIRLADGAAVPSEDGEVAAGGRRQAMETEQMCPGGRGEKHGA